EEGKRKGKEEARRGARRGARGEFPGVRPAVHESAGVDQRLNCAACHAREKGRNAQPSGMATNRLTAPERTRISTELRPERRAAATALLKSAVELTALPATSRMISPAS